MFLLFSFLCINWLKYILRFRLLALAFVFLSSLALAEENSEIPMTRLDDVTVLGTRSKGTIKKNPHTITIISRQNIEKNPVSSIAEALDGEPGISITDSNSAGTKRIRIRGESSRRVTILIDGQELTDHSNYGTPILENISEVEKIEIVHGPASVLYGSKAIGGVVNITTKSGRASKPINGEIGTTYYGESTGWLFNTALFGQINQFNYRLALYQQSHKDIKVPESSYTNYLAQLEHTKNNSEGFDLSLGYGFGENLNHLVRIKLESLKLSAESWRDPGILESGFIPLNFFDINLPKRDKQKIGFFYDGEDINSMVKRIHFDLFYQIVKRGFENTLSSNIFKTDNFLMASLRGNTPEFVERIVPDIINSLSPILRPIEFSIANYSDDKLSNYGGTLQVDFQFPANHYVIAGINYLSDRLVTNKLTDITVSKFIPQIVVNSNLLPIANRIVKTHSGFYRAHIDTISFFGQDEWQITKNLKMIEGLRYYKISTALDRSSKNIIYKSEKTDQFLKSLSFIYTGMPNTSLRIGYSEGYITPNLMQLFINTDAGGIASLPNPKLRPETSKNIELGARYADSNFSFDGTLFLTRSKDYISLRSCQNNPLCSGVSKFRVSSIYENVDKAKTYGLELRLSYLIPKSNYTSYVDVAWLKRKERLGSGETYDTDTPKISGRMGIRYDGNRGKRSPYWIDFYVRGASGVTLASELNPNNPGGDKKMKPLSGWMTANLSAGISPKIGKDNQLQVVFKFNNITNSKYRSSFNSLPGSSRNVSLSTRWIF